MPIKKYIYFGLIIYLLFVGFHYTKASDASELGTAFNDIDNAQIDTSTTVEVKNYVLNHKDLKIVFEKGRIAFFKPVVIDSTQKYFGGYFEGYGQFQFEPEVSMEKNQMYRFFHTDSLNRSFDKLLMLFTPDIYQSLMDSAQQTSSLFNKEQVKTASKMLKHFTENGAEYYIFETLRNLVQPLEHPFLLVDVTPENTNRLYYMFNPYEREEVNLFKRFYRPGSDFMEQVCSYSQYNTDESYANINGFDKDQINITHYNIDASINKKGNYDGVTKMTFDVIKSPLQLLTLNLYEELAVDRVIDSSGQQVMFLRYEKKKYKSQPLYLIFNRPLDNGEKITLSFYYNGKIAQRQVGEFFVSAGANWYPSYSLRQKSIFDMKFKTLKEYAFIATGNLVKKEVVKDTLVTTWKVIPPARNVSFDIGNMKLYKFKEDNGVPVDIYFSQSLHQDMGRELTESMVSVGKHMEKQVAEDIMNSLKLFSNYFGPYPYSKMSVGEILAYHGEAFPGFLHLGFDTWINTDSWGYQRLFRAHEVAHQWWGVGVGYATYHDQWLSEGFAEYSALLYLQAVSGNDQFLDMIKNYRNDIFSARKFIFGSGVESGPIALGYRTSSTKTIGDNDLIIYKKGALVLHMLRNFLIDFKTMNEDKFFNMMKEFYAQNRGKNITTVDFRILTEKYTGIKMDWFFNEWIYRNELPTYQFSYRYEKDKKGKYTAHGQIITIGVTKDFKMYVPLEIDIDNNRKAYLRLLVDKSPFEFSLPDLPQKPKKLILNPFESVLAKVKQ